LTASQVYLTMVATVTCKTTSNNNVYISQSLTASVFNQ